MAWTDDIERLVDLVRRRAWRLVAVGDGFQLPAVGRLRRPRPGEDRPSRPGGRAGGPAASDLDRPRGNPRHHHRQRRGGPGGEPGHPARPGPLAKRSQRPAARRHRGLPRRRDRHPAQRPAPSRLLGGVGAQPPDLDRGRSATRRSPSGRHRPKTDRRDRPGATDGHAARPAPVSAPAVTETSADSDLRGHPGFAQPWTADRAIQSAGTHRPRR